MALSRRTGARFQASIWPGFVDAMTGLLLVLTFVISIFMAVQFVLRETISGQEGELNTLAVEVAALAEALGVQERRNTALTNELGELQANFNNNEARLTEQEQIIASLTATRDRQAAELSSAAGQITSFEQQVAALVLERDDLSAVLSQARSDIDAQAEAAKLAAAKREALEAMMAELRAKSADQDSQIATLSANLDDTQQALSEEEQQRLLEAQAAAQLRDQLKEAGAELTSMTLALEQQRKKAEETLTLLAAARTAEADLNAQLAAALIAGSNQADILQAQLDLSKVEAVQLRAELDAAKSQGSQTDARITALSAELATERTARLNAETALAEAQDTAGTQETQLSDLSAQLAAALARLTQADTLSAELESLLARNSELVTKLSLAEGAAKDAQAALRTAQTDRQALQATATETQDRLAKTQSDIDGLTGQVADLTARLDAAREHGDASDTQLAGLQGQVAQAQAQLDASEARSDARQSRIDALETENAELTEQMTSLSGQTADQAELIAAQSRAARLAAELEAASTQNDIRAGVIADLQQALAVARARAEQQQDDGRSLEERLAAAVAARLEAQGSAEDVRAKLMAALAAQKAAEAERDARLSEAEQRQVLLAEARDKLAQNNERASVAEKQAELLNQQVSALRQQLSGLQALLDDAKVRDIEAQVQLQNLGSELNAAIARVAAEERKRRKLEEAERIRLEAEKKDLERYRSEFFGRLRDVVGAREGVRIEGDRFVFSSEVLFPTGDSELSDLGSREIAKVAAILREISSDIPDGVDWVIRVDGHTDDVPLRPGAAFADNWELSQARALSVVRVLIESYGIAPQRLAANGFGQFQPLNPEDTAEARAQNRRIELKLTER